MFSYDTADVATTLAEVLEYMDDPSNAFGVWVMVSGAVAGAYFLSPALLASF
jgi:hypothetical protein